MPTLTSPPCRKPGYRPQYKERMIYGPADSFVVPTRAFALVLEEQIEKHNVEAEGKYHGEGIGGLELICHRASAHTGKKYERYVRRIYDIRKGLTRTVGVEMVEEILMGCGLQLHLDVSLPVLPAGLPAAHDAIEARLHLPSLPPTYTAARRQILSRVRADGRELPNSIIEELALDLWEFSLDVRPVVSEMANDLMEYALIVVHDTQEATVTELPAVFAQLELEAA